MKISRFHTRELDMNNMDGMKDKNVLLLWKTRIYFPGSIPCSKNILHKEILHNLCVSDAFWSKLGEQNNYSNKGID